MTDFYGYFPIVVMDLYQFDLTAYPGGFSGICIAPCFWLFMKALGLIYLCFEVRTL